jgi:catechol 2,3-dioxygenase-like lactoylglutathione lyase family enzyme
VQPHLGGGHRGHRLWWSFLALQLTGFYQEAASPEADREGDDLEAAIAFFVELGLELEGEAAVEGRWVDRVVGLDDVRVDVAMVRTPDGHGRLELTKFHTPTAVSAEPNAPANTLGLRRIMFAVEDIEDVLAGLRAHGAELVGELERYEDSYRLCYVRGPEGIIVALAEQLS